MAILKIGQSAPAFALRGIDDQFYTLNHTGAQLTLAVFFKTTCPTCVVAFPYIEKIHRAYSATGLAVWGISQHDRARSAAFAAQYGATFPILIDEAWQVSRLYDPDFVPTLFLITPSGQILDSVVAFDKAGLNRLSNVIATRLGVPVSEIAPAEDGRPPFKPG